MSDENSYIPLVAAVAEGKALQVQLHPGKADSPWVDCPARMGFLYRPENYRIKPMVVSELWINLYPDRVGEVCRTAAEAVAVVTTDGVPTKFVPA